ncbi:cadherin-like beta sandwich domain-containing protein, partial [Mucilaginibacter sp.]|uniref:cadherin-like beta sandwich domain-containing protein n=1 Tax=Mucilaginibacter sp. TaxID=1882438 RepID=UPI003262FC43
MERQLPPFKNLMVKSRAMFRAVFILAMILACADSVHGRAKADTLSGNNNLRLITASRGTFNHPFDPAILNYKITFPAGTEIPDITISFADSHASYFSDYDGQTYYASNFPNGLPLTGYYIAYAGVDIYLPITAENGAVKTYHLQLAVEVPDSKLSSLAVTTGILTPAFSPDITNYELVLPPGESWVSITPITHDPLAVERINNISGRLNLQVPEGVTDITVVVTAKQQLGKTYYNIKIKRPPLLTSLAISAGALTPAFHPLIEDYSVKVPYAAAAITITPTHDNTAGLSTIKVNGTTVSSGTASAPIPLVVGTNTISTVVTTSDGVKKTYTAHVIRVGLNDVGMSLLAISEGALARSGTTDSWTASVSNSVNSVTLTVASINATTITINGVATAQNTASAPITLTSAITIIPVELTREDGITKRLLTIRVNKAGSNNTGINYMAMSPGVLTRVGTTDTWTATVSSNLASAQFAFGTKDPATIKVNGAATAQNTLSAPVPLSGATTTIPVEITAEDGVTKRQVTLLVKKGGGSNTGINNLVITNGTLKRVGTSDTWNAEITSDTFRLTVGTIDPATIIINGELTAQNTPSKIMPVPYAFNVQIIAEDEVTTRWIIINVKKVSHDTGISTMTINPGTPLARVGATDTWTSEVSSGVSTVQLYIVPKVRNASIKINGAYNTSLYVTLTGASTTIPVDITATDGETKRQVTIIVNKAPPPGSLAAANRNNNIEVVQSQPGPEAQANSELTVHQSISPNGDGINDRFTIDGITAYPQNTVSIINRNGQVIYATKGYNNYSNAFDGHAVNGTLQQPGTYFYS